MIRELKLELEEFRRPMQDPEGCAERDAEAGVPRDVGEARYIRSKHGLPPQTFDPGANGEHQRLAARAAELRPVIDELTADVHEATEAVGASSAHPVVWLILAAVMGPIEILCAMQLFQTIGLPPVNRLPSAIALTACTFGLPIVIRGCATRFAQATGWARVWPALGLCLSALAACLVVPSLVLARMNPGGESGLPPGVRIGRLVLMLLATIGPAVAFKFGLDQFERARRPHSRLKTLRKELKRAEKEHARIEKRIARLADGSSNYANATAADSARYQTAYDRATSDRGTQARASGINNDRRS